MNLTIKQLVVQILLGFLRGLILVKRFGGRFLKQLSTPFVGVTLFFLRWIGVPVYRFFFFFRRFLHQVLLPAKHKVLFLVSNRYTIHVVMAVLVATVTFLNSTALNVRAEEFGQKTVLYRLVTTDEFAQTEVVEASDTVVSFGSKQSYLDSYILHTGRHIDLNYLNEVYVTPKTGTSNTNAPDRFVPVRSGVESYVIQDGETLGGIADKFGLNLSTILWANKLTLKSTIHPGDTLTILPVDGVVYKVKSGDTLSRIARSYGVEPDKILGQNNLASADKLKIGDALLLPGGEPPSPVASTRQTASITNVFKAPSKSSPSKPAQDGWVWPTDWRVMTQYYGWKHTGIDVDGDYTTSSYASYDGTVIWSGWRRGYGLTVEVDHGNGLVTRYAHHSKNYVSVGDEVSAGQVLAQTGTTGNSTGTHLHFEVIRNGKFQNPLDYVR